MLEQEGVFMMQNKKRDLVSLVGHGQCYNTVLLKACLGISKARC